MVNKTLLAGSTAILSDIKVEIVDWAINETELSMDNYLYRNFIFLREFRTITPTSFDFIHKWEKLPYIIEKHKDQALLYATSYWGNMIIHIDQIKHLTKTISMETPYRDKYDVKLDVSKDYDGCIRYRLDYKENWYSSIFTDFSLSSVIAKEYQLCKQFSYHIDPLPNKPIVLRNRNKHRETEILTKRENETWKDFIYDKASYRIDREDVNNEFKYTLACYNLFLSPKNYHELMTENYSHRSKYGIEFLTWGNERYVGVINKRRIIDVTIYLNPSYKE